MVGLWVLASFFLIAAPAAHAESTAFPTDVIESPLVKKADVAQHFKNIFGRSPTGGELMYWHTRLVDKPTELEFLPAMGYWAAQGTSPSIDDNKFVVTLSGTGRDIFAGQTRRHTVTITHTNPVAQSGYLDIKINVPGVKPTPPFPNVQRTLVDGITRLRHRYVLAPAETLSVDMIITAPNKPNYTFEAILRGRGMTEQHVTKIYSVVPETLANPTYQQRQIPLIFARVYGRTPTKAELAYWRGRLTKTHRLETIQGAMEVMRNEGKTTPGLVLGAVSQVAPVEINSLFRAMYGRSPTVSEWHYWVQRLADKPNRTEFTGALAYHKLNNLSH